MDPGLLRLGLGYTRRRKKWILLLTALGFTGYGAYRIFNSPTVVKKRERVLRLAGAVASVAGAVSDSAEAVGFLSEELRQFVVSESDQIPNSFKQISKISSSDEVFGSIARVSRALTLGLLRGMRDYAGERGTDGGDLAGQIADKLFSTGGCGFASVVVGSFARNMILALFSDNDLYPTDDGVKSTRNQHLQALMYSEEFRELVGKCVQVFVGTAVAVYLEKTMDVNPFDEIFQGLTNPMHEERMKEMLVSVCNGAVETLIRTSHEVLTNTTLNSNGFSTICSYSSNDQILVPDCVNLKEEAIFNEDFKGRRQLCDNGDGNGVVGKVFSSLSLPGNRRFLLDMTGTITFEMVRSLLEFVIDKLSDGFKRGFNLFHVAVLDRIVAFLTYVVEKSSMAMSIWVSVSLHILGIGDILELS